MALMLEEVKKPLVGTTAAQSTATRQKQQQSAMIPYRDDIQADKERASREKIEETKAIGGVLKDAMKESFKVDTTGMGEAPPAFQAFKDTLRNQDPAFQALQQTAQQKITTGLEQEPTGLGLAGERARAETAKALEAARQRERDELIRAYGPGTGQVQGALRGFDQRAIMASAEQESALAAAEEDARRSQASEALQNALNFINQRQQIGVQREGLDVQRAGQQTQRDIAAMQIGSSERMQQAGQTFEASQNALNRELQQYSVDARIKADQALQTSDQLFQTASQQRGFLNEKELTDIRAQIESDLMAQGFTQEQAIQIADQKHQMNIMQNEQAFTERITALDQAWRSGERVDAQEHEKAIEGMRITQDRIENELNRTLQLDIQANDIAYRSAAQTAAETHEKLMTEMGFDNQTALQMSAQVFEREMVNAGFSQEQAMAANNMLHEQNMARMEIEALEQRQVVELAQQDRQFYDSLNLDQKKLDMDNIKLSQQIYQFGKEFGLRERELNATLGAAEVQNALNSVSIATQLFPDNEEALKPFADRLFQVMAKDMGMSDADIERAINTATEATGATPQGVAISEFQQAEQERQDIENPEIARMTTGQGEVNFRAQSSPETRELAWESLKNPEYGIEDPDEIKRLWEPYVDRIVAGNNLDINASNLNGMDDQVRDATKKTFGVEEDVWKRSGFLWGDKEFNPKLVKGTGKKHLTPDGQAMQLWSRFVEEQGMDGKDAFALVSQLVGFERMETAMKNTFSDVDYQDKVAPKLGIIRQEFE